MVMGKNARREPGRTTRRGYLNAIRPRYKKADKVAKKAILDEFCRVCGYHRKYAIRLLNQVPDRGSLQVQRKKPGPKKRYHHLFGPCQNDKMTVTMGYSLGENAGALATSNYIIYKNSMSGVKTLAHEFGHQYFSSAILMDSVYAGVTRRHAHSSTMRSRYSHSMSSFSQ